MSNLNPGGLTRVLNYVKTWVTGLLNDKANSSHSHTTSQITDFPSFGTTSGTICEGNDSRLSGISNSDIDDIADDAGFSSGSLPASEDIFITGDIIPNTDNSVDVGASSKNIKMIYTKGITINGTQLSTVATSGSYTDLSNKPTIPTYSAGSNLSLSDTTFNVSSTPSFTNITISGYTITID